MAGTTLSLKKSVNGYQVTAIQYKWTLQKTVDPNSLTLGREECAPVSYHLVAAAQPQATQLLKITGTITIKNLGNETTQGLQLVDYAEYQTGDGNYHPIPGTEFTIIPPHELVSQETWTYDYTIYFAPQPGATYYGNFVHATILNYSNHIGVPYGPDYFIKVPDFNDTITETVDETAVITDSLTCPAGFTCSPETFGPFNVTAPGGVFDYSSTICNDEAAAGITVPLVNDAVLTTNDTKTQVTASNTVTITTPENEGTTITISKTVDDAHYEDTTFYKWTLNKNASPSILSLDPGECGDVTFGITANRSIESHQLMAVVSGTITVNNTGTKPTDSLVITDKLQVNFGLGWTDLDTQTITPSPIPAGESRTFDYTFTVPAVNGSVRNWAQATITNYVGHVGEAFGPAPVTEPVTFDGTITNTVDESAVFSDVLTCPTGFSCTPDTFPDVPLTDSSVFALGVHVCNVSAVPGTMAELINTGTLTTNDRGIHISDTAVVELVVPGGEHNAIIDLLESIALEENALAHIMNAEGEKIQAVLDMDGLTIDLLLEINDTVERVLKVIAKKEMLLEFKLDEVKKLM